MLHATQRRAVACIVAALAAVLVGSVSLVTAPTASAATGLEGFQAGNLISDVAFYNAGSLTKKGVTDFIAAKGVSCVNNTGAGVPCLKNYKQTTPAVAANAYCAALSAVSGDTAAGIISRVTTACKTSPQVMLAMIQKESALVTKSGSSLTARSYAAATGAGCPDFTTCDASIGNFFNQVYKTAWMFSRYRAEPSRLNYKVGANQILYNPETSCGKASVTIANVATASLYTYTPYTPNAAALNNPAGTGDLCSAYGNRNFYRLMKLWFPSSTTSATTAPVYPSPASTLRAEITLTFAEASALSGAMGSSTGPMTCTSRSCSKPYANGRIYSTPKAAYGVRKAIYTKYAALGGPTGPVGLPIGRQACTSASCRQDFEGGTIDSVAGLLPTALPSPTASGAFSALRPARVLDTRSGNGAPKSSIGADKVVNLQVTGRGGVPSTGVTAVVLSVTVLSPTRTGRITAFPSGSPEPNTSNVHFAATETSRNVVMMRLGAGGKVALANNSTGSIHLVADVVGYYTVRPASPGLFRALTPARILDTIGGGGAAGAVPAKGTLTLQVLGRGGVASSDVSAVVMNVAVMRATSSGLLTAYPSGTPTPDAYNITFPAGKTVSNLTVVKVGADGSVKIRNDSSGTIHLLADVTGYFTAGTPVVSGAFVSMTPTRLVDTRTISPVGAYKTLQVQIAGRSGIPSTGVAAVISNTMVERPAGPGYVTAYPSDTSRPATSSVKFLGGQTIANLVSVGVSDDGYVSFANRSSGSIHVITDAAGYFKK